MKNTIPRDNLVVPSVARKQADEEFASWIDGVRNRAPEAIGRLACLVSQLLSRRLPALPSESRAELLTELVESICEHVRRVSLARPALLLEVIEREAARLGVRDGSCEPRRPVWLERLSRLLPELEADQQRVLEGLYLESLPPGALASRLGLSSSQLRTLRRRALAQLRARMCAADA